MVTGKSRSPFAPLLLAAFLPLACSPAPPTGPVDLTLPPLNTGDTIRTTVHSSFKGGKFSASSPDGEASGSISIERQRVVEKTVLESGADGPTRCSLSVPSDDVEMTLLSSEGSRMDSMEGPLVGVPIEATSEGNFWSLALTDRVADPDQAEALLAIETFENRQWFPGRPVAPGESWDYDPIYFRTLVESDLGNAAATGRMTLRSLENSSDGSPQARLDLEITSTGNQAAGQDLKRQAAIEARGTLIVDLLTMLDREIVIEGTIRSGAADDTSQASLEVPLRIEIRREILPKTK